MTDHPREKVLDVAVVIPTVGRDTVRELLATLQAASPAPAEIVVADDRPDPRPPLSVPEGPVPTRVVTSGGRGPAAARNAGWLATRAGWIAFVDDDVVLDPEWTAALGRDLTGLPDDVGASTARIVVPPPPGRRPTDEERRTTALTGAHWITADMAYRRHALLATGGFDERFPRAFREDSDLALRTILAGFGIVTGARRTVHPIRARGGWFGSVRAQVGNIDNALLRAKFGRSWREKIGEGRGRTGRHLLTVTAGLASAAALAARSASGDPSRAARAATIARLAATAWLGLTAEFTIHRILPGPRTPGEIAAMIASSVLIPPVATAYRAYGEFRARRLHRPRARAVLFDRDGTLIRDVPYLTDPDRVQPVPGAAEALSQLRRRGLALGVVSNQSGVGRGLIRPDELQAVNRRVDSLLGPFDTWQTCPHRPEEDCGCRKPEPGLVLAAARELGVAPRECVVIGDIGSDVQAAVRAGSRAVLVPTPVTRAEEIAHARMVATVAADLAGAVRTVLGAVG